MLRKTLSAAACLLALALPPTASAHSDLPGEGWFHFECGVAIPGARIDPLVVPGTVGVSHEHQFVGNKSINENSTNATLRANPATTCMDDREEKLGVPPAQRKYGNAIWYPRFYDSGVPLDAIKVQSAYSVGHVRDFEAIQPFGGNTNFIAGTSSGGPQEINGQSVYKLSCPSGNVNFGSATIAPLCNQPNLRVTIFAPDCWDGVNQSPAGFKSHLAYSKQAQPGNPFRVCPASHPVLVPAHRITIDLPTRGGPSVTVATGSGATASTQGNMSTIHYDYMSAVNHDPAYPSPNVRTARTRDCLNENEYCGGTSSPVIGEGGGL